MKTVAIIGAGAAGMFCAANLRGVEGVEAVILERTNSPLKKVVLSGGGRCNFTNTAIDGRQIRQRRRQPKGFLSARGGIFEEAAYGIRLRKDPRIF